MARGNKRHARRRPTWVSSIARPRRRDDLIFVEAVFEGTLDEPDAIRARMEELVANREASQPIRAKTGGSTFKNPPGHKAWQLIDEAGCRGLMHRRRPGERETLQFPDQYWATPPPPISKRWARKCARRVKAKSGVDAGMGNQAGGRAAWTGA